MYTPYSRWCTAVWRANTTSVYERVRAIFIQAVKFKKSTLQLRHSLEFNKLRGDVTASSATVQYNELPACAAFATILFLLTQVSCNVTLKCIIFYKLIMNIIITVCIHYKINTLNGYYVRRHLLVPVKNSNTTAVNIWSQVSRLTHQCSKTVTIQPTRAFILWQNERKT